MSPSRAGIFDLPLELRQRIYDEILPCDRMLAFDEDPWESMQRMEDACRADPWISTELRSWARKRCGVRFVLAANAPLPSSNLAYDQMSEIQIYLGLYDVENPQAELMALRYNISAFVDILRRFNNLPLVSVAFQNQVGVAPREQEYWLRKIVDWRCQDPLSGEFPGTMDRVAALEYLLTPLLRLPACGTAIVEHSLDLLGPDDCREAEEWASDVEYAKSWCDVLEQWLEGPREKPFGTLCGVSDAHNAHRQ